MASSDAIPPRTPHHWPDLPVPLDQATRSNGHDRPSIQHLLVAHSAPKSVSVISSAIFLTYISYRRGTMDLIREKEMTTVAQPNEEQIDIAPLPWHRMTFETLTMYGELSAARIPEEFAAVRSRFQSEWSFNGGFVS